MNNQNIGEITQQIERAFLSTTTEARDSLFSDRIFPIRGDYVQRFNRIPIRRIYGEIQPIHTIRHSDESSRYIEQITNEGMPQLDSNLSILSSVSRDELMELSSLQVLELQHIKESPFTSAQIRMTLS